MKVIKQLNYDHTAVRREFFRLPSLTVPDMALTPREILERFTQGRSVPDLSNKLVYTGDDVLPDPRMLDISEIHNMINDSKATIEEGLSEVKKVKERRKKATKPIVPEVPPSEVPPTVVPPNSELPGL